MPREFYPGTALLAAECKPCISYSACGIPAPSLFTLSGACKTKPPPVLACGPLATSASGNYQHPHVRPDSCQDTFCWFHEDHNANHVCVAVNMGFTPNLPLMDMFWVDPGAHRWARTSASGASLEKTSAITSGTHIEMTCSQRVAC